MEPEIVYRWAGPRDDTDRPVAGEAYLPGVPARDLTAEDLATLPAHILADVDASPLYERVAAAEEA